MAANPMDVVIAGWGETVGSTDSIWDRADDIDAINAAAGETVKCGRHAWGDDLRTVLDKPVRSLVSYSYGCASIVKEMDRRISAGIPFSVEQWTILVAVNRTANGQKWEDLVVVPAQVKAAVAFNTVYRGSVKDVLPVIPECCPIRNPGPARVNQDCFWQGVDHVNIVGKPIVASFIKDTQYILVRQRKGP